MKENMSHPVNQTEESFIKTHSWMECNMCCTRLKASMNMPHIYDMHSLFNTFDTFPKGEGIVSTLFLCKVSRMSYVHLKWTSFFYAHIFFTS